MRRYYIDFINNKVVEDEQGYYVPHDDVEAIIAENERLNAELNAYHDLIDRIDYCYLQIDGSYGDMKKGGLAYCVADKVKYIHRKGWINQSTTEEK